MRTSGGFRSGREKKCCVGPGFGAGAVVVAAGSEAALFLLPPPQPVTKIASRATEAASFTRESIDALRHPQLSRTREGAATAIERQHRDPACTAAKRDRGLEPALRNRRDRTKALRRGAGQQTPLPHLGCAVPAHVQRPAGDDHVGRTRRAPNPAKTVRAVGVDAPPSEAPVEADRPPRPELGEPRLVSPAGEEVAVSEALQVALVDGDER